MGTVLGGSRLPSVPGSHIARAFPFAQLKIRSGVCSWVATNRTTWHNVKTWFFLLISLIPCLHAWALVSDGQGCPYLGIVQRNAFNLRGPSPLIEDATARLSPFPKITLTGITTILGRKIAFITIAGSKAGQLPESLMLTEGQVQGEIQVHEIDEKAGCVKIIDYSRELIIGFDRTTSVSAMLTPRDGP